MGVILRFRVDDVTVMADIKRMFHQVFVAPQVRGAFVICGGQMVIYEQSQRPTRCLSEHEHVKDIRKFQDLLGSRDVQAKRLW